MQTHSRLSLVLLGALAGSACTPSGTSETTSSSSSTSGGGGSSARASSAGGSSSSGGAGSSAGMQSSSLPQASSQAQASSQQGASTGGSSSAAVVSSSGASSNTGTGSSEVQGSSSSVTGMSSGASSAGTTSGVASSAGSVGASSSASMTGGSGSSSTGTGLALQILHFSDWHGQLDPVPQRDGSRAGGAAVLRAYFNRDKAAQPNTLITTGGDEFGASPPLASLNNEEPAVRALNLVGLQVSTLGNHNFDRGPAHLNAMLDLADYVPVTTNLTVPAQDGLLANGRAVAPYRVVSVNGTQVAFVGLTNLDAATLLRPGNLGAVQVSPSIMDTVQKANAARAQAAAAGATVFVALAHMGITTAFNGTGTPVGPLVDLANALGSTQWDLLLGDHTNFPLNTLVGGLRTVECLSQGQQYARVSMDLDNNTRRPVAINVTLVTPTKTPEIDMEVAADNVVETMLAPFRASLTMQLDPKVGEVTDVFPRGGTPPVERSGEAAIGNLVADSLYLSDILFGEPSTVQLALSNGGGIRSALPSSYVPSTMGLRRPAMGSMGPYDVVRGDIYSVLPFGNAVVWLDVTGADVWAALEHGISQLPAADGRFPQVSGFSFTYDAARPAGMRVVTVQDWTGVDILNNTSTTYRLATSDFLFYGGDGYSMLAGKPAVVRQELMAEALEALVTDTFTSPTPPNQTVPTLDGRNAPVAQVVINEVNHKSGNDITMPAGISEDLVELRVTAAGNLLGLALEVVSDTTTTFRLATLPDLKVAAGDLVVLHLFTQAQLDARMFSANGREGSAGKDQCADALCFDGAWDVTGNGTVPGGQTTPLVNSSRRLLRVVDARGSVRDLVSFTETGASAPSGFPAALEAATAATPAQWAPLHCADADMTCDSASASAVSVVWTGAATTRTGNSVQRKVNAMGGAVDTHTAADFATAASTMGAPNTVQ